jgi:hypothetical protein
VIDAGGVIDAVAGGPVGAWGWPSEISEMAFMVMVSERAWVLRRAKRRLVLYIVLVESCMVAVVS